METDRFGVAVNGKPIDVAVRHTLKTRDTPFSLNEDMPRLADGYIADSFFRPELPVWVQQYSVEGIDPENQAATAAFVLREDPTKTLVLWEEKSSLKKARFTAGLCCVGGGAQHKTFFGIDRSFMYRRIFVLILLLILMKIGERKC